MININFSTQDDAPSLPESKAPWTEKIMTPIDWNAPEGDFTSPLSLLQKLPQVKLIRNTACGYNGL